MASLFSGLGAGLGKAAGGYFGGQERAEKEIYRRKQIAEDRDYKKQLLAAKKKETDPHEKIRQRAGMTAQMILKMRADPANQAFFESPQGKMFARRLEEVGSRAWGIWNGTILPGDADTYAMSFAPTGLEELGAAPAPGASQPEPPAGPQPFQVPLGGGRTAAPPEFPALAPAAPPSPGATNPAMDSVVGRLPGISPAFQGVAPPSRDTAIPVPDGIVAAPAVEMTPYERWDHLRSNRPIVQPRPGMTPKQIADEQRLSDQVWMQQVREAREGVTLEDEAAIKGSERTIKGVEAGNAKEVGRQKVIGGVERIKNLRADTEYKKGITPVNIAKGKEDVKNRQQSRQIAREREDRSARAQEHREKIDWARLAQQDRQFQARMERAERTLQQKAGSEEMRALQAEYRGLLQRYQKTNSVGPFRETQFAVTGEARQKIGNRIDAIEKRLRQIGKASPAVPAGGGKVSRSTRTVTTTSRKVPAAVLGKKPAAQAKPASGRAALIAEMKRRKYTKEQMQRALKAYGG